MTKLQETNSFFSVSFIKFRIGKVGNQKRVVGVLLGSWQKKVLDVSNSFAGKTHVDSIFLGGAGGIIQINGLYLHHALSF